MNSPKVINFEKRNLKIKSKGSNFKKLSFDYKNLIRFLNSYFNFSKLYYFINLVKIKDHLFYNFNRLTFNSKHFKKDNSFVIYFN